MSPDYHSWFMEKKGDGEDKNAALASFQKWDGPLHPDVTILQSSRTGNSWRLQILEQNDFSKLIRFPGWRATVQLKVEEKKVNEIVYTPDTDNPDYKMWLQPALEWLQKNRPNVLNEIYKNNRLVKTESTALEWVKLLREWREEAKVQQ